MRSRFSKIARSKTLLIVVGAGLVIGAGVYLASRDGAPIGTTTTTSLPPTTTTSEAPTTTAPTTTPPTTVGSAPVSPVNGLTVEDPALLQRRLLAVKIDNHPLARPQSGVERADAVVEVLVEGVTRFLSLWMQSDSAYLGPMRSGRPTDGAVLAGLNEPTFAISGAQDWVQQLIRSKGVHLVGEVRPATFRIAGRSAPHDLYVDTALLRQHADTLGYPDLPPAALWSFGPIPATATPVASARMNFAGNLVTWTWDEASGLWLRQAGGSESNWVTETGETGRIGVPVMVALLVEQYTVAPPAGTSGKALPSSQTVGSGVAYVFAEGKMVEGRWTRSAETEWFILTDAAGAIIPVPPGQVWISLVPVEGGLTVE